MSYLFDLSASGEITSFDKSFTGTITLESSYDGIEVETIGTNACSECNLSSIDMSQTHITSIKTFAFLRSYNLNSVVFPSTLVSISSNTFILCKFTSIHIPASVTTLVGAFNQNLELNTITVDPLNSNYKSYNNFIFSKDMSIIYRGPINIEFEDIPYLEHVKSIQTYSLSGSHISRFIAPPTLDYVRSSAFDNCYLLAYVDLTLANMSEIASMASIYTHFKNLILPAKSRNILTGAIASPKLHTLFIPSSLEGIQTGSFSNLESLRYIYLTSTIVGFPDSNIFYNTPKSLIKCYVPTFYLSDSFGGIPVIYGSNSEILMKIKSECFTVHYSPFNIPQITQYLFFIIFFSH